MPDKVSVLIAGIAGASLGTEIAKSLNLTDNYTVYGCDISPLAYGHYTKGFAETFVADNNNYTESVIAICKKKGITYLIPGGEVPMNILAKENDKITAAGIKLVSNPPEIITTFSNKQKTFEVLAEFGCQVPKTIGISTAADLDKMVYPCIVKPSTGTGGSDSVFLASDKEEALIYVELLKRNGRTIILQEYIPVDEGEYTIGVLSLPNGEVVDGIVMQRIFNSKLSVAYRGKHGLISSGYSQGLIGDFKKLKEEAILIARSVGSKGPFNIQARVKNGKLVPFEINPRFSASTFLRAKAGFNEVDIYLQHLIHGTTKFNYAINFGYYLRSFEEVYIPLENVKK